MAACPWHLQAVKVMEGATSYLDRRWAGSGEGRGRFHLQRWRKHPALTFETCLLSFPPAASSQGVWVLVCSLVHSLTIRSSVNALVKQGYRAPLST